MTDPTQATTVCYRHPDRPTRLACSECGRPICVECSHDAAVGQKCPECSKAPGRYRVINARNTTGPQAGFSGAPVSLKILIVAAVLFRNTRELLANVVKHAGAGRVAMRALKNGERVWILADQRVHPHEGIELPFFGRPAATSLATPRLAELGRAAVVPYQPRRLPNGQGYEVRLLPALEDFPSADAVRDLERINKILEGWIREQPEQYLWIHRRFKPAHPDMPDPYAAPGA